MSNVTLVHSSTSTVSSEKGPDAVYAGHPAVAAYWNKDWSFGDGLQYLDFACLCAEVPKDTKAKGAGVKLGGGGVPLALVALGTLAAVGAAGLVVGVIADDNGRIQ